MMNEREKDTAHRNSGPIYMCTHTFTYIYMHRKYIYMYFTYMHISYI